MKTSTGNLAIAVDFGGSKIIVGLIDKTGNVLTKLREPSSQDIDKAISTISRLIERLLEANKKQLKNIAGIGISVPGMADSRSGSLLYAPFYDLKNFPLARVIENSFGIKTCIENDVNSSALAELRFGHGKRVKDFFWITISNGVGGALVTNGRLYKGAHSLAGEIGHIVVKNHGKICDCGKRGCLETIASGRAIERTVASKIKNGNRSIIPRMIGGPHKTLNAKVVCEAARKGDPLARKVLQEVAEYLGKAISTVINICDPQMVILGGGVSQAGNLLLDPVRKKVKECAIMSDYRAVPITRTKLGYYASLVGAATLVFYQNDRG